MIRHLLTQYALPDLIDFDMCVIVQSHAKSDKIKAKYAPMKSVDFSTPISMRQPLKEKISMDAGLHTLMGVANDRKVCQISRLASSAAIGPACKYGLLVNKFS